MKVLTPIPKLPHLPQTKQQKKWFELGATFAGGYYLAFIAGLCYSFGSGVALEQVHVGKDGLRERIKELDKRIRERGVWQL